MVAEGVPFVNCGVFYTCGIISSRSLSSPFQTHNLLCLSVFCLGLFLLQVLTWAKQHQQRLEVALLELMANAELLEELLTWIQWAETTLIQREQEPQNIEQVKALIAEHQVTAVPVFSWPLPQGQQRLSFPLGALMAASAKSAQCLPCTADVASGNATTVAS